MRSVTMCDKSDRQKKRFIEALTAHGTVCHAAQADVVENVIYQQAAGGNTLPAFFYLKAHRPIYRDRVTVNLEQVQSDIDEMIERFSANPDLLPARPVLQITE